ncbi:MAG: UvrB/UvrC motif-containing protein [Candidatus Firestonebacteria bacterium]
MLCEICKKENATVHFSQAINEKVTNIHLCEFCAGKKGVMELPFSIPLSVKNMLPKFLNVEKKKQKEIVHEKCNNCGFTNVDFKKIGYLGCSECYRVFRKTLMPLLNKIHGDNLHIGKFPSRVLDKTIDKTIKEARENKRLKKLQLELQNAITQEQFEDAAILRDKIKSLENNNYGLMKKIQPLGKEL